MTEMENIRHFFERIAQYANDAGKEVASGAVPYSYIAQIGLTVNSALKYVDQLPNKHSAELDNSMEARIAWSREHTTQK